MKKAIIAFAVLLVLSLVSTICFAAATGTKVVKSAIEYFAENDIRDFSDIDKLEDNFEQFIRDKMGVDLDVHIGFNGNGGEISEEETESVIKELPDITDAEIITDVPELTETTTEEPVSE
jgi:hypothetical protein